MGPDSKKDVCMVSIAVIQILLHWRVLHQSNSAVNVLSVFPLADLGLISLVLPLHPLLRFSVWRKRHNRVQSVSAKPKWKENGLLRQCSKKRWEVKAANSAAAFCPDSDREGWCWAIILEMQLEAFNVPTPQIEVEIWWVAGGKIESLFKSAIGYMIYPIPSFFFPFLKAHVVVI